MEAQMTASIPTPTPTVGTQFRLAQVLSIACLLLAIGLPAATLYAGLAHPSVLIEGLHMPKPMNAADLTLLHRIAAALVETGAPRLQAYGLLCARRCFESFASGNFFTREVVKGLRGFAKGLFFAILYGLAVTPLLSLLLTMHAG